MRALVRDASRAELPAMAVSQKAPNFSDQAVEGPERKRLQSLKGSGSTPSTRQPPTSLGMVAPKAVEIVSGHAPFRST
eukprot:6873073-Pyramimonas_sp.AAC.1